MIRLKWWKFYLVVAIAIFSGIDMQRQWPGGSKPNAIDWVIDAVIIGLLPWTNNEERK